MVPQNSIIAVKYLNTSHVKVQHKLKIQLNKQRQNLNTSHVKVQHAVILIVILALEYLNTSHVKVQHLQI